MNKEPDELSSTDTDHDNIPSSEAHYDASLLEDVSATIADGKTYLEAELNFQKTRASFVASTGRSAAGLGLAAFAFLHLALVALVVGAVIALSPILTPLGATGAVAGVLIVFAAIFVVIAARRGKSIAEAFKDEQA